MTTELAALLRQRDELKARDPGVILLFREEDRFGDWYRAFHGDAEIVRHVAMESVGECVLHRPNTAEAWCSFAAHHLDRVLASLRAAGRRVAVIGPHDGPKPPGAAVERIATAGAERPMFTPGPWYPHRTDWRGETIAHKIYISGDEHETYEDDDEEGAIVATVATAVAIVEGNATSRGVTEANANLICSAPDLLAACQGMMDAIRRSPISWIDDPGGLVPAIEAIEAAVNKATQPRSWHTPTHSDTSPTRPGAAEPRSPTGGNHPRL